MRGCCIPGRETDATCVLMCGRDFHEQEDEEDAGDHGEESGDERQRGERPEVRRHSGGRRAAFALRERSDCR